VSTKELGVELKRKTALEMYATLAYIFIVATVIKEPKKQRFVARVTAADKLLFQQAAAIEGRSVAKFIISHVREVARQVINQSQQIELDARQSQQLVEALLAPPSEPTAALTKAMVRYREQVTEV
jgi:uncharacterized protein (DUF1778 family)